MAARALALPTLARSAMRATGRVHFPVAKASFRMTASTAIASIFRCSPIEGGTTTVAARNRRPDNTRWTVSDFVAICYHQSLDPRLNFTVSWIEAKESKVLSPLLGSTQVTISPPQMGVSRAILIPTLSVSKRALIPSDGAAKASTYPNFRAAEVKIRAADFGQRPLSCHA